MDQLVSGPSPSSNTCALCHHTPEKAKLMDSGDSHAHACGALPTYVCIVSIRLVLSHIAQHVLDCTHFTAHLHTRSPPVKLPCHPLLMMINTATQPWIGWRWHQNPFPSILISGMLGGALCLAHSLTLTRSRSLYSARSIAHQSVRQVAICQCDAERAKHLLEAMGWNLEVRVTATTRTLQHIATSPLPR